VRAGTIFRLEKSDLDRLLVSLRQLGYRTLAPIERDGTVMWDGIESAAALPWGRRESQQPGHYRLEAGDPDRCFDVLHGPQSLKSLTFASREKLSSVSRKVDSGVSKINFYPVRPEVEKIAVLGARACDLAALAMQENILTQGEYADPFFAARRDSLLIVAVNCTRSADTCFCASMDTGPETMSGFDLAMTELDAAFLIEAGSEAGSAILAELSLPQAGNGEVEAAATAIASAASSQSRAINQHGLPQALFDAHNHPQWDDVAGRCLSCTNCTVVCPTCFCHAVEEVPSLDRSESERFRSWDSCFSPEHGYIHGKNMRPTTKERYRMWMTHKLGAWIDQFGASGCVGCGRCISWCPVGIDLVEEYRKVRKEP